MFSRKFIPAISVVLLILSGCETAPEGFTYNTNWEVQTPLCNAASAHVTACTGNTDVVLDYDCDPEDAELLLATPCSVLEEAAGIPVEQKSDDPNAPQISFTCQWLGIGCPVDDSCAPSLSQEAVDEIIYLSDPTTLIDEYDTRYRIAQIASIFEYERDPIGMFAIVYRHITNNAVASVEDGYYENPEWTRRLITAFARRYLVNLHGHLTGSEVSPQWKKYYKLSRNCKVGRGRVLGLAIATHLMVDLTYALHDVKSIAEHEEDFMLFGEISLWVFPDLVADTQTVYDTDVSNLLRGFFFGEWVDGATSEGTTTTFIYQTVRANAWRNSQNLWAFPRWMVDADITTGWGMAEVTLAMLDASGAL